MVNLDRMTVEELAEFWMKAQSSPARTARKLFGDQPPTDPHGTAVAVLLAVKNYAMYRQQALVAKRNGSEQQAEAYQRQADGCYLALPGWAKFREPEPPGH